jgi:hypothetical protein
MRINDINPNTDESFDEDLLRGFISRIKNVILKFRVIIIFNYYRTIWVNF